MGLFPPPPFCRIILIKKKAAEMIKGAGFTTLEMEMDCDIACVLAVKRARESERGALKGSSSGSWLGDF
jgi:hypothetical protein